MQVELLHRCSKFRVPTILENPGKFLVSHFAAPGENQLRKMFCLLQKVFELAFESSLICMFS